METQLVDRYMPQLGATQGVYVVVWMSVPDVRNLEASHKPKWASLDMARTELDVQASNLSGAEKGSVRVVVVDAALR